MRYSEDFIEKVRDANDIVEIIGQYTELKGSGHRLMGRCPFPDHNDKSPSFSVSSDNQLYYCYGCKKGGNLFTFLETFSGMSFPEAIEFLARRASIPLPERPVHEKRSGPSRDQKDLMLKVNRAAAVCYHHQLKAQELDSPARKYLAKRGLSDEAVEKFRLGLAHDDRNSLVRHFKARKVPLDLAEQLGLIKPNRNARPEDSHYDTFRDRLMFPIFSATGDVIGFGGRTLGEGIPKYLNSSDSPIFNKSRVLYGIHETGKFIRAQDAAVVVEGYMDAIALYTAGLKNVVAILGTAFTPEHAKILKRHTPNVIMLLDGDEAGLNGAERSLPILLEAGLMAKGFILPEKMDPDDFVKVHGPDKLRDEVERAPELFTLLLTRRWMQGYHGSPSEKVNIVAQAADILRRMANRQLADLYMLELSRQLDVEVGWVRRAVMSPAAAGPVRQGAPSAVAASGPRPRAASEEAPLADAPLEGVEKVPPPIEKISLKEAPRDESFVLSLLLHHENLMAQLVEAGTDEILSLLTHAGVQRVLRLAVDRYQADADAFASLPSSLMTQVDAPALLLLALTIAGPDGSIPDGLERKLMTDYLNAIRQRYIRNQARALASQLKNQPSPDKLAEFMSLQRDRLSLNNKNKE